jgi:hypothetical protein
VLRRGPLLVLAALLSACAPEVRYAPRVLPPQLPTAQLPKLLFEDVVDRVGGGEVAIRNGTEVYPAAQSVAWADLVHEAFVLDLQRLGWPTTESRAAAGARLTVTVERARSEMNPPGFSVPVKQTLLLDAALKTPDGRTVWDAELKGIGHATAPGGAWASGDPEAENQALNAAMAKFDAMLVEERPWERLGGAARPAAESAQPAAASARPAAASAPSVEEAVAPSDIDLLPPAGPQRPASYAVVIGVEHYRAKLPNADYAAGDARLAAEYFKRVLGVPAANVTLLTDELAAKGDFEKYFESWLPNQVASGDTVYVYYSGHGAPDPAKGDAYLLPYDGDPTYVETTGYSVKRLLGRLAKLPAKQVYLALDSCFSGAGGRSVLAPGARPLVSVAAAQVPPNVTVISASAADQISNGYREKGHGLFTYYFLKGLRDKKGDLRAAFDYARPEVSRAARRDDNSDQTPQWRQGL